MRRDVICSATVVSQKFGIPTHANFQIIIVVQIARHSILLAYYHVLTYSAGLTEL